MQFVNSTWTLWRNFDSRRRGKICIEIYGIVRIVCSNISCGEEKLGGFFRYKNDGGHARRFDKLPENSLMETLVINTFLNFLYLLWAQFFFSLYIRSG